MGQASSALSSQALNVTQKLINNDIQKLQLSTDSRVPALLEKYNELNSDITTTLENISTISSDLLRAKQNQFNAQLVELNIEKKNILENSTQLDAIFVFKTITYSAGIFFAIIIISHTFIDKNILYKIFYCVWGALLYPLVLLYGVYNSPNWRAILIPLVNVTNEMPGWASNIILSALIWPFKYTEPSFETASRSKYALQLFSLICLICFGIAYTL